jgi:isoaspartyl peptidase/L-asparaginase-like protein (Ntn-hydrolase superfamily)
VPASRHVACCCALHHIRWPGAIAALLLRRTFVAATIIGSARSDVGLPAGMDVLASGGHALDAVEAALRVCEDNLDDHYVGTGGLPNARGEVELDASLMVGSTRAFGAVAAIRGFPHPISVARAVLTHLPQHCLLVGEGAEYFAEEQGFERGELLTAESKRLYREALDAAAPVSDQLGHRTTPANDEYRTFALELVRRFQPHDGPWGTVDVLALDSHGELVVGVSTSGFPWKYPGRVGDSALPGAGNYCDVRYGGAACTGRGETTMRAVSAKRVVDSLAQGADPSTACREMLADAATLPDRFASDVRSLCLTPDGRHGGAAYTRGATYHVMTTASTNVETVEAVAL